MSVRGSKNKIILYIAGACSIVFVIFLYQNASQRLEEMEKSYERCHLNEESLSAQLQVNLEYKVRLEKSLQQEKADHSQIKEDLQNKLEEERQARERENLESINKFAALQQQHKFLQTQHEDVNLECGKLRQLQLSEIEEKSRLENLVQRLKDELKLVKENRASDIEQLKAKYEQLELENIRLKEGRKELPTELGKHDAPGSEIKLPDKFPLNSSIIRGDGNQMVLPQPLSGSKIDSAVSVKSPTSAKKSDQELFPSGNAYVNTSTPMINPDAVNSQDKILSAGPVPQPKQEPLLNFPVYANKENVGAKPDKLVNDSPNNEAPAQVLRAPDLIKDFDHVPAIQNYREKLKQGMEKNNNAGGEVGDEGQPLVKNDFQNVKPLWREGEIQNPPFAPQPMANEIPKNSNYHYQADYEARKDEGEDDDDVDQLDYHNEKNQQQQQQPPQQQHEEILNHGIHVKIPYQDKRESVMIQPK